MCDDLRHSDSESSFQGDMLTEECPRFPHALSRLMLRSIVDVGVMYRIRRRVKGELVLLNFTLLYFTRLLAKSPF